MATTRSNGYVVTAAVWNAVLSRLTDDGATFSGAVNGSTGAFSSTLAVTGASTLTGNVSMGGTLALTAAGGTISERGRTTPLGEWIAVSFSAGNFTAHGGTGEVSWTVGSGDVEVNRYTLIGKTLLWSVRITQSTIGNTPNELRIVIPGGFTANHVGSFAVPYFNDNGALRDDVIATPFSTYVSIARAGGSNFLASTDATAVYFSIFLEIQ